MSTRAKTYLLIGLIAAVALVIIVKNLQPRPSRAPQAPATEAAPSTVQSPTQDAKASARAQDEPTATANQSTEPGAGQQLPLFVEVGAHECIPCKMMQPVLDELRREYAGKLQVEFADVRKDPSLREHYQVRSIPTQVIYDVNGKEVYRHVGYWPKEEIDAKLKELGIAR